MKKTITYTFGGWNINSFKFATSTKWEQDLIRRARNRFDATLSTDENFMALLKATSEYKKPNLFVSIKIIGRQPGRPDLAQRAITIWRGDRKLISFIENESFGLDLLNLSL